MKNKLFMLFIGAALILLLISISAFIYLKNRHSAMNKSSLQTLEQSIQQLPDGKVDNAVAALKETLNKNPMYAEARVALGMLYARKGLLDEAITEFKSALTINPELTSIYQELYLVYKKKGLEEEAKKALASYEKLSGSKK